MYTIFPAAASATIAAGDIIFLHTPLSPRLRLAAQRRYGPLYPGGGKGSYPSAGGAYLKDGAPVACGFGTVYEAIEKIGISGNDAVW